MHKSDRGILVGANGTGKSTLAAHVLTAFRQEYPDGRIMVADTKPRWRAAKLTDGTSARRIYRAMGRGDTIPGSASLSRMVDWNAAWNRNMNPSQSVIVQRLDDTQEANIRFQVAALEKFFATQRESRPSLAYLDEGMDFFGTNAGAKGGSDIVQRCFRAGRERGLATLIGVQRPVGINKQCLTETNWCAMFRINNVEDIKHMYDMGWPKNVPPPRYDQEHAFRLWRAEQGPVAPLYRLKNPSRIPSKNRSKENASKAS